MKLAATGSTLLAAVACWSMLGAAQTRPASPQTGGTRAVSAAPQFPPEEAYLRPTLTAADQRYQSIDGSKLKQYVAEITRVSRRYRDAGHQYWGRIIGTEGDTWNAEWMADKLRAVGATHVYIQSIDLPPQWLARSWEVGVSSGSSTVALGSAWPAYATPAPPGGSLDVEAAYVGLGTEADFFGRDVRGKAVFIYSMPMLGSHQNSADQNGSLKRAADGGAVAIFEVIELPGNIRMSLRPSQGGAIPTFSLGSADGAAVRTLIERAARRTVRVKVRLDVAMVPGLKTSNVWGDIPGSTDENVLIVAHRDGFFDGASDNASGMATAVGLTEYFAKIPQANRGRTIRIAGTPGHHNNLNGSIGVRWMADNRQTVLAKTAIVINSEHTSHALIDRFGPTLEPTNAVAPYMWGVNGSPALQRIAGAAFDGFGITRWARATGGMAEISRILDLVPAAFGLIHAAPLYHSDAETDETVPAVGLESSTRAYAKIIEESNKLSIDQLRSSTSTSTAGR